jgi:hypothetical protein
MTDVTDESPLLRFIFATAATLLVPAHGVLVLVEVARVEKRMLELPAVFWNVKGIISVDETPNGIV